MNDFETSKREEYGVEALLNPTFEDLDGKYAHEADIQKARNGLMNELATNDSVAERQIIHDILYDLKTARHNTNAHMNKIARNKRG